MSPPDASSDSDPNSEFTFKVATRMATHIVVERRSLEALVKQQTKKCMDFFAKWRNHTKDLAYWPPIQPKFDQTQRLDMARKGRGPGCPFSILGSPDGSAIGWAKYCKDANSDPPKRMCPILSATTETSSQAGLCFFILGKLNCFKADGTLDSCGSDPARPGLVR